MDGRYETFLTLCNLMNYRKTADAMHLTQPAVTRQIQSLEEEFGIRLFQYDHRKLFRTPESEVLENYILSLRHNYDSLKEALKTEQIRTIRVGATKTIGNYTIPEGVEKYLSDGKHSITLSIDNTEALLSKMKSSELDFTIIEGIFDKSQYASRLFREETFTGICAKAHRFAGKTVKFKDLFSETLLVREKGSGTRDILERELQGRGYSFGMFKRCCEISSLHLIARLVASGIGISFAYHSILKDRKDMATFQVKGFELPHEFNIVWLKHTRISEDGEKFLNCIETAG